MKRVIAAVVVMFAGVVQAEEKKPASLPALALHQLAAHPAVQEDLQLSEEQKKSVVDMAAEARQALRGVGKLEQQERQKKFREVNEKVRGQIDKVLKKEQLERLAQIDRQQRGALMLSQRQLAQKLELTQEQRQKLRSISQELAKTTAKIREETAAGAERTEKVGKARAEAAGKAHEVLTDEQKKTWKEMLGKAFDVSKLLPQR